MLAVTASIALTISMSCGSKSGKKQKSLNTLRFKIRLNRKEVEEMEEKVENMDMFEKKLKMWICLRRRLVRQQMSNADEGYTHVRK